MLRCCWITLGDLDQEFRRAQFSQPEAHGLSGWLYGGIECLLKEASNHRPISVPLSLLCLHQIREREQIDRHALGFDACPPLPKLFERGDPAQPGHHVDTQARNVRPVAAEVNRMSAGKGIWTQGRNGDRRCIEFGESITQATEVGVVEENKQIQVPAKLRRAVEYASLAAH